MAEIIQVLDLNGPSWGDIAMDSVSTTPVVSSMPTPTTTPRPLWDHEATTRTYITPENEDEFYGYEVPDLVLRKHIWENFPVTLIPLGKDESGAERHSVQWHIKNLVAGRDETDFQEYVERTERRLLKALNASAKWDVLDSETEEWFTPSKNLQEIRKEICILRMVFLPSEEPASAASVVSESVTIIAEPSEDPSRGTEGAGPSRGTEGAGPSRGPKPVLKKLNDIKFYFPVVWHPQPAEGGHPIYSLEIHGKQAKDRGLEMGALKADLLAALRQSTAWRVLASRKPTEVCCLELAFKPVE